MPTATYAGTTVTVNDEGFFVDPDAWRSHGAEIAAQEGIDELTEPHWQVIRSCARNTPEKGPVRRCVFSARHPESA